MSMSFDDIGTHGKALPMTDQESEPEEDFEEDDEGNIQDIINQATVEGTTPGGEVISDLSDDDSFFEDDPTIVGLGCVGTLISLGIFSLVFFRATRHQRDTGPH